MKRYLQEPLLKDLERKMVLLSGPRQTGKTTLARMMMAQRQASCYWNDDIPEDRLLLTRTPTSPSSSPAADGEFSLHFVRDREKSEVDFLLVRGKEPLVLVEAKLSETDPAPALIKMKKALRIPAIQLVNVPGISRKAAGKGQGVLVASAERWLAGVP